MTADLRHALDALLASSRAGDLAASVDHLMAAYRGGEVPRGLIVGSVRDAIAYAAYRMPATYEAARSVLQQVRLSVPSFAPATLLDIGAGTGAMAWAATDVFDTLTSLTLVEQSAPMTETGQALGRSATSAVLRQAEWRSGRWPASGDSLPAADLVTAGYLLGELAPADRTRLVDALSAAPVVVIIEAGTPAGYRRIIEARRLLIERGLVIVAPCPHQHECALAVLDDWCHLAERVERSPLHRRLKDADLPFEDEKFSYVAAVRDLPVEPPQARVVRRPRIRKGLVDLTLCEADGLVAPRIVSKRQGALYRAARDVSWGDRWP